MLALLPSTRTPTSLRPSTRGGARASRARSRQTLEAGGIGNAGRRTFALTRRRSWIPMIGFNLCRISATLYGEVRGAWTSGRTSTRWAGRRPRSSRRSCCSVRQDSSDDLLRGERLLVWCRGRTDPGVAYPGCGVLDSTLLQLVPGEPAHCGFRGSTCSSLDPRRVRDRFDRVLL